MQFFLVVKFKADEWILAAGRLDVFQLDFFNLPRAAGGLPGFGRVGGKTADERLQVGDLRFLLGVVGQHTLARLGRSGHIIVVVTGINAQLAVIQIGHVGTHAVQKMPVVRNDDNGVLAGVDHILQPADGIDVKVVGRLVQ
ncbi:MAG: hypothetical protein FCKEOINB_02764 [Nitrosomonas sp.]|nr:hypothetical protein [Nitrosomonas sp.]